MSVRERSWINRHGTRSQAIVVDYTDADGRRRLKTFKSRQGAERFNALVSRPDQTLNLRVVARRLREVSEMMTVLADDLMEFGSK